MKKSNHYCVIMAGGIGSRFWPLSRTRKPKQFLDILGTGRTMIQETFDRFNQIIPAENILVVTSKEYEEIVKEQLPEIPANNILLEPGRRNTAPCIAYANYKIRNMNPKANIVVAPSDHVITKRDEFLKIVEKSLDFVEKNNSLLTLGLQPSRPETGYGYIQINTETPKEISQQGIVKVKTFTEKPNYEMAVIFKESGEFFWNSGIFFWNLESIMKEFEKHLPEINSLFADGSSFYNQAGEQQYIQSIYPVCKSISIDYGIMEKADNVYVIRADIGWSDLGTWGSLYEHMEKDKHSNAIKNPEQTFIYESSGCIVNTSGEKTVVIHGLKDFIIAESDNIILICEKKEEQLIKQYVTDVKLKLGESLI